jgi:5-(carboxyamino)imidazole ribonucleotide mutase
MIAAKTVVPVLGVPIPATAIQGLDSLLSIVQMPKGVPVGTLAIGAAGAMNAGLLAVAMLATTDAALQKRLVDWRAARRDEVLAQTVGEDEVGA